MRLLPKRDWQVAETDVFGSRSRQYPYHQAYSEGCSVDSRRLCFFGRHKNIFGILCLPVRCTGKHRTPHLFLCRPKNGTPTPTPDRAEAENYRKAHIRIDGFQIAIENPDGTYRQGVSASGVKWRTKMHGDYGYIKGTVGYDDDHLDVTMAPGYKGGAQAVYIVNQVDPETGKFDEHKCIIGCATAAEAKKLYLSNYEKGWKGCESIVTLSMEEFKRWAFDKSPKTGPKAGKLKDRDYGWIGVDLDGTLAKLKRTEKFDEVAIGAPIPKMVERVKAWRATGREVRIMTARAASLKPKVKQAIEEWCEKHLGEKLPITNEKDPYMLELWDDRAIGLEPDTGRIKAASAPTALLDRTKEPYLLIAEQKEGQSSPKKEDRIPPYIHYKALDADGNLSAEVRISDPFAPELNTKYLYYWHVNPAKRGQGLGGALLDEVLSRHQDQNILLEVGSFDKVGEDGHRDRNNTEEDQRLVNIYRSRGFLPIEGEEVPPARRRYLRPAQVKAASAEPLSNEKLASAIVHMQEQLPKAEPSTTFTGPEAIRQALATVSLDDLTAEAKELLATGKKTKRSHAVKLLNIAEGMRRTDTRPDELMITRVPVIPPVYRPYATQGGTFIAGDANELYQDLFKMRKVYNQEKETFGAPLPDTTESLRKSIRALYGYDDPVEPKTKERGVVGYMHHLTGKGSSKNSFFQRKLVSKPLDNTARSTIIPDPDLTIDEVGVPEEQKTEKQHGMCYIYLRSGYISHPFVHASEDLSFGAFSLTRRNPGTTLRRIL